MFLLLCTEISNIVQFKTISLYFFFKYEHFNKMYVCIYFSYCQRKIEFDCKEKRQEEMTYQPFYCQKQCAVERCQGLLRSQSCSQGNSKLHIVNVFLVLFLLLFSLFGLFLLLFWFWFCFSEKRINVFWALWLDPLLRVVVRS